MIYGVLYGLICIASYWSCTAVGAATFDTSASGGLTGPNTFF